MRLVVSLLSFLRRFSSLAIFALLFALLVMSHTVSSVAWLTSSMIGAVSGLNTLAGAGLEGLKGPQHQKATVSQPEFEKLSERNRVLETENTTLKANNKQNLAKISKLEAQTTVNFRGKKTPIKTVAIDVSQKVQTRTAKVAAANLASAAGESIPVYGIAIIVAATGYELKSACDTMIDLHDLDVALNPELANDIEERARVCGLKVPSKEELWQMVKSSPLDAWKMAVEGYKGTSDWVESLEPPDFSGSFSRLMNWAASWL